MTLKGTGSEMMDLTLQVKCKEIILNRLLMSTQRLQLASFPINQSKVVQERFLSNTLNFKCKAVM